MPPGQVHDIAPERRPSLALERLVARRDDVLVLTSDVADFEALRAQAANSRRIAVRRP